MRRASNWKPFLYLRNMQPKYKRILLKLSGESLMGENSFGIDPNMVNKYAQEIKSVVDLGVEVAIVVEHFGSHREHLNGTIYDSNSTERLGVMQGRGHLIHRVAPEAGDAILDGLNKTSIIC